jgi:hypothetical protein
MRRVLLVCWILIGWFAAAARASELKPETAAAFDRYIRATEARMNGELQNDDFLAIDRLPDPRRKRLYERLQHGEIYIDQLRTLEDGHPIRVPSGLVHHWVGVIFIRGATLAGTLAVLRDYNHHQDFYKPDVRESKLISQSDNEYKIHLQFYKKSIVTVGLNADFDVNYTELGSTRSQSVSHSVRIAEVENVGKPNEREYPVGKDHGYLWRLDTYWRLEEKDGGVYLQNESVGLTRTVPFIIAWLVNPLVKSIPRNALSHLLVGTRNAVLKSKDSPPTGEPGAGAISLLTTGDPIRNAVP